ncbi:hypothetical protein V6237_12960 [Pseudoalteromonas carrageenovora]|uniref:hypothetical protein n=1 Tax=Pseudoalteromonas carrageenovora TaxID=227 RepID=UPI00312047D7
MAAASHAYNLKGYQLTVETDYIPDLKVSQKLHKDGSLAKTKTSDFSNVYTEKDGI